MFPYTKDQLAILKRKALNDLVEYCGGATHLAKMLGKPLPTVNSWIKRGMISRDGVESVMSHPNLKSRFTKEQLRPDL